MYRAVRIDGSQELWFRILAEIVGDDRRCRWVNCDDLARKLGESEEVIRYNVKKLRRLGYLKWTPEGYEPTDKVLFLKDVDVVFYKVNQIEV